MTTLELFRQIDEMYDCIRDHQSTGYLTTSEARDMIKKFEARLIEDLVEESKAARTMFEQITLKQRQDHG